MDNELKSPIIIKYQNLYKEDPKSRVFAPLAEAYRKYGLIEDAIEILKKGIRIHPDFVLAYLGLAYCYFDKQEYNISYETLRPLVDSNRENLRLQKLYSKCCLELKKYKEALDTLKYLLYINPRDTEVAEEIKNIESSFFKDKALDEEFVMETKPLTETFGVEGISELREDSETDNWVKVDFPKRKDKAVDETSKWEMKQSPEVIEHNNSVVEEEIKPVDIEVGDKNKESSHTVSHTLIDLYLDQGFHDRAIEILEKIIELNPEDENSIDRLVELKNKPKEQNVEFKNDTALDRKIEMLTRFQNAIITRKIQKSPY